MISAQRSGMALIYDIPHPTTGCWDVPEIVRCGDDAVLRYDYETEDGTFAWAEIRFRNAVVFHLVVVDQCTIEHLSAYSKVISVANSAWAHDANTSASTPLTHYRAFFDDHVGCFEVLAESVECPD